MKLKNCTKALILILLLSIGLQGVCYAHPHSTYVNKIRLLQHKQAQAHAKVRKLKILENIETNKLYRNQKKLETNQSSLNSSKFAYTQKQQELVFMEQKLKRTQREFIALDNSLRSRIRQIFKNQRTGFFELLLTSTDINTFIDRVHFEGIVVKEDYKRLQLARAKAAQILALKQQIEIQKRSIADTIDDINSQQVSIQSDIQENQGMINKLKTNRAYYERSEMELARQSASIQSMLANLRPVKGAHAIRVTAGFARPIGGPITSPFGYRTHPIFKTRIFHSGIDIGGPSGGSIRAANNGRVIFAGWYGGYGQVVILDHGIVRGQPITTLYAHMSSISVSRGQSISKGETVGHEGSTGYSTGPHCHFEVRVNGQPRNPLNYI